MFIPSIAVAVRRFHDVGYSGYLYLSLALLPLLFILISMFITSAVPYSDFLSLLNVAGIIIASIVILVILVLPGTTGPNKYGKVPLK